MITNTVLHFIPWIDYAILLFTDTVLFLIFFFTFAHKQICTITYCYEKCLSPLLGLYFKYKYSQCQTYLHTIYWFMPILQY